MTGNATIPLPPHSADSEEAVIGSVLINPDCLYDVGYLQPDDFFLLRNAIVWAAIQALSERHESIDNITVIAELRATGKLETVGGSAYITGLSNAVPHSYHAESYARLIEAASTRRKLLSAASEIANAAVNENSATDEVVDRALQTLDSVATRRTAAYLNTGDEIVSAAVDEFLTWLGEPAEVRGLRSGIPELDKETGGFTPGRPYTFYGSTNMGKSTLATFIAVNAAEQAPGLIVTTEMNPEFWIHRAVSDLAGIPFLKLKSGQLTREERNLASSIYDRLKRLAPCLHVLRNSSPTPFDLKGNVRKLMRQNACEWVLIDSINNISVPGVTDIYPKTSAAADCAQSIGLDLGAVVFQTSQTGRNSKMRLNKMPQLGDGEGSGKIEQNSGMVFGIYRHDYYVKRGEAKPNDLFPEGGTILQVLKNERGPSGQWVPLRFEPGGFTYDNRFGRPTTQPVASYMDRDESEEE